MKQELLKYVFVLIMAGSLSTLLSFYALLKMRDAPGAKYYIGVTFLSTIFTFSYVLELTSTSFEQIKFWLGIEYLAMPFIPAFILLMCFEYVGQKIKQSFYYILFALPITTIFMHHTNDLHHLYYISMKLRTDSPFPILMLEGGPWFYVHSLFMFLCIMTSVLVLTMQLKKSFIKFRMQILTMVAGLIIPMLASYFYINGMSPYGIDLGPVSMSISFLFHGAALLSFQMFNVAPIARDTVFESMKEGVIVLNQNNVIVDYNKMMLNVLPHFNTHMIGKSISEVLDVNLHLMEIINNMKDNDYEVSLEGKKSHYHIRFSPVINKNNMQVGRIITFIDVTERVYMQEKLKYLASTDGLTQVLNRTFFMKKAEEKMNSILMNGGNVSVIMFDIDHFKQVNDTFGHEAGDMVLKSVPNVAKESLRPTDVLGRYGGEEFIIFMQDTSLLEAYQLANAIRIKVSESYSLVNNYEITVTSSFGISHKFLKACDKGISFQTLMRQADQALYDAKRNGRNCVQLYKEVFHHVR